MNRHLDDIGVGLTSSVYFVVFVHNIVYLIRHLSVFVSVISSQHFCMVLLVRLIIKGDLHFYQPNLLQLIIEGGL